MSAEYLHDLVYSCKGESPCKMSCVWSQQKLIYAELCLCKGVRIMQKYPVIFLEWWNRIFLLAEFCCLDLFEGIVLIVTVCDAFSSFWFLLMTYMRFCQIRIPGSRLQVKTIFIIFCTGCILRFTRQGKYCHFNGICVWSRIIEQMCENVNFHINWRLEIFFRDSSSLIEF